MRTLVALLASLVLLASCASPERIAELDRERALQAQQQREQYRAALQARCSAYGFQPGTEAFSNCLMQLDAANQAQDAQIRATLLQGYLERQTATLPSCSSRPPGLAGYEKSTGACR